MSEAIASKAERLAAYNANIAAAEKDPSLSPETGKPLSKMNAARFGAGFLVFGVLWMSGLGIVSAVLLPMHYKTIPGVNADALVGIVNAFTAVASLVANLMFGNFSDRSRSRFGRRKVPVVVASVLFAVGIAMPWIFKSTMGMYLFAGIAGLGYAVYSAVDQALLVDVLPNKEEAGKDLGILNMATTLGQMCGPVVMSAIVVNLGYNFAFPTSIALAIIGCFFIMAIKKVK